MQCVYGGKASSLGKREPVGAQGSKSSPSDQDTEGLMASPVTKSDPLFTLQTGVKAESCACVCVFVLNADAISPQTFSVFPSPREYLAVRRQGSSTRRNQRCVCRGEKHGSRTSKKSLAPIK